MAGIKVTNKLNGGLDTDTAPEALNNTKLRDAVNVDIYDTGKYSKLTNIRGTTNISTYLPNDTDLSTLNILGVFNVDLLADWLGTDTYVTNKALIIYTYDSVGGSQIFVLDLVQNQVVQFYPNPNSSTSLDFPVEGTISASYTKERGVPEIYWDDNKNELRKLTLKYSTSPSFVFPTLADINVRRRVGGIEPDFTGYGTNGYTTAGTYQISYRFYNTTKNTSTKWSLFTNPIPTSNSTGCFGTIPFGEGGQVGQTIQKTIKLSVDFANTPSTLYDSIQLAVVKNVDGLAIPSNTVYITLPSTDWYNNPTDIEYSDAVSFEAPYPLEQIVLEDAAIKCAKTQLIKDNVLVRGNIEYNNFENDRGTVDFDDAYTIKDNVCYNNGSDVVDKKGHFREEVYAFAVAYFDEFFNFGLVQPLDFTKVYKMNSKRTLTVTSIGTPNAYNQLTIVVSSTADLVCGDYLRYQDKAYQVCEITNATTMLIKYRPDLTTTSGSTDLEVLYGQEGNQMQGWTWKFPARSDNKFAIFSGAFPVPQGLGLHIEGLKNHPSWAKGLVIVRQDRIKNILFQSPHIPAIAVQGVATQGLGPITYDDTDPTNINKFDNSKADYKGQLDFIAPKIIGLGHAMNVVKSYLQFEFNGGILDIQRYYIAEYPLYTRQKKTYLNTGGISALWYFVLGIGHSLKPPDIEVIDPQYGAETPKAFYVVPPDYILNNGGQPTFNYVLNGSEKIEVVDAVALLRTTLNDETPFLDISNLYQAVPAQGYYYGKEGYILQNTTDKVYFVKLSELDTDILGVTVNKGYDIVLGEAPLTLDNYMFDSEVYKNINIANGTEQLSVQQGSARPIPGATNSFINVCATQRGKLILTNNPILDFTKVLYDEITTGGVGSGNLFPNIPTGDYDLKMYDNAHLFDTIGAVGDDADWFNIQDAPVKNIFTDDDKINSGAYILNVTKGLPDNRYSKISNNWKFTGAYRLLTESEVANNTPVNIDVWGGDCFLTNYQIKVNNNTPRISDIFETFADEAKDYIAQDNDEYFTFDKSLKTGSFENNVEILSLIIESEVNTGYIKENERVATSKPTTYYSKPFLYQYNGSYSINNQLKAFVTKAPDIIKNFTYQARFVWSMTRLYQAEGSAFIDTEGFDFFPVNNKRDLDEQYGGITSLVDFGDYMLHLIQESKIRTEPINRTVTNTADNKDVVMLSTNFVGSSGQYMPYSNGSQHIRSVQVFNGVCFFMDAERRMLVTFGSGGYSVLSQTDINKYFLETFANPHTIKEKDLIGFINTDQEKQEYWLIKTINSEQRTQSGIIYDAKAKNFKTKIDTETDLILNGVSNGEFLFLNSGKSLFTAYTNDKLGYLLDKYRKSKFSIIVNDYPSYTKTFNVMNFEMKGGFILNKDSVFATTPNNFAGTQQTPDMLIWDSSTGQLPPFQNRNFQYWLNRIRQADTNYKLRGDYMQVDFIINNDAIDNREVSIASIITACEINARVR